MNLKHAFAVALCAAALSTPMFGAAGYRVELVKETSLLDPVNRGINRFTTCSDGRTVLTTFEGTFTVVDANGVILKNDLVAEMTETSAITCSGNTRIVAATKGEIRIFSLSEAGDVGLERSFPVGGLPVRLLETPNGQLYVLGMARVAGDPVFLRRYRLADGSLIDAPTVDVPFQLGSTYNNLLINGDLLWHPTRQEVDYFPANPARVWSFDSTGALKRPGADLHLSSFQAADVSGVQGGRPDWTAFDNVKNAAALPDGRVVLQVFPGRPADSQPMKNPGELIRLAILDSDFNVVVNDIRQGFMGLLAGSDAGGNLYFVDLVINRAGNLCKARLVPSATHGT